MPFLLDTVTLSELRRSDKADPNVARWQGSQAGEPAYLSVITLNEIRFGLRLIEGKDPAFAQVLSDWYRNLINQPDVFPILPVDRPVAEVAARFRADHRMAYNDALIAATAQVHQLTLATRNTSDFQATGIKLINPWDGSA